MLSHAILGFGLLVDVEVTNDCYAFLLINVCTISLLFVDRK
jgi:hypothetical protein